MNLFSVLVVGVVHFPLTLAIPSPGSLQSDLTILTNNDLYGASSPRAQDAALVLDGLYTFSEASSKCAQLGEKLWQVPAGDSDGTGFLRALGYGDSANNGTAYWVSGMSANCATIDPGSKESSASCDSKHPALCSQSASLSTYTAVDIAPEWQVSVHTRNATMLGYRDKLSFRFQGIKYATIPARFDYPSYTSPTGNVSALSYGAACIQPAGADTNREDCLFLNIWTPYLPQRRSESKKKAVMMWIHGGGFQTGMGSDTTFDGGNLASRGDVVVVTINYRLSTFGFLALSNSTLKGNYGLADQIAALDWLRAHIEDFGGDKDRITIFGQSAGAAAVRALLASPKAKGKFSGAIMQSNPGGVNYASTFTDYLSIADATNLNKAILNETGCTQTDDAALLACLRAVDPYKLLTGTTASTLVVDGTYLTTSALPLGSFAPKIDVALLVGNMHDDGDPFSQFSTGNASQALTEQSFDAAKILSSGKFPVPQGGNMTLDIFNLTSRVTTDAEFRCVAEATAFAGSQSDIFPAVYAYEFERSYQIKEWSPNPPTCEAPITADRPYGDTRLPYYKCHSGELYYVFGTILRQGRPLRDDNDIPFSQYVVDTWSAFAREGNPNPDAAYLNARGYVNTSRIVTNVGEWMTVKAGSPKARMLDVLPRDGNFEELAQCEVLDLPLDMYVK